MAIHHQAAQGFARGSDAYQRGRPEYPPALHDWVRDRLALRAGRTVLELGAGTGKFTRVLVETQATVIAVEPVAEMLAVLTRTLPAVEACEGTAQAIPLADGVVDAVVCAQSFHWFATPVALAEIARVLRPGGRLALIWNVRDERVDWVARLTEIITPYEGDTPRYHTGQWRKLFPHPSFGPLAETHFPHGHTGSPEQVIIDRTLSVSFIAALPSDLRERVADDIRALIADTPTLRGAHQVTFPYVTTALDCVRLA